MREHNRGTNTYQSPQWRKMKYQLCRRLGFSQTEASRMRDFRIRTIRGMVENLIYIAKLEVQLELLKEMYQLVELERKGKIDTL